jgi:AbrB family looped-hinge helix DNA binding protein
MLTDLTRLSTKGQIILPKNIRESREWEPGTEFIVEETSEGVLLRPAARFPAVELDQVVGCLPYQGKAKTVAEMNAAISGSMAQRHDSGRY